MSELIDGTKASLAGDDPPSSVFAHPLAFNLIPQIDQVQVSTGSALLLVNMFHAVT